MCSRVSMSQETLDSLLAIATGHGGLLDPLQFSACLGVHNVPLLNHGIPPLSSPRGLAVPTQGSSEKDESYESSIGHKYGVLIALLVAVVPALPVLPSRINRRILARLPLVHAVVRRGLYVSRAAPAGAPTVVCAAFRRIRQYGVGGDDQAVALQTNRMRTDVGSDMRGNSAIRVVYLHKLVERALVVGRALSQLENLVRRRELSLTGRRRPRKVFAIACAMRAGDVGVGADMDWVVSGAAGG